MKRHRMKVTKRWLRYVIADEKKAKADYKEHGFPGVSKQEGQHEKKFEKIYKKM